MPQHGATIAEERPAAAGKPAEGSGEHDVPDHGLAKKYSRVFLGLKTLRTFCCGEAAGGMKPVGDNFRLGSTVVCKSGSGTKYGRTKPPVPVVACAGLNTLGLLALIVSDGRPNTAALFVGSDVKKYRWLVDGCAKYPFAAAGEAGRLACGRAFAGIPHCARTASIETSIVRMVCLLFVLSIRLGRQLCECRAGTTLDEEDREAVSRQLSSRWQGYRQISLSILRVGVTLGFDEAYQR